MFEKVGTCYERLLFTGTTVWFEIENLEIAGIDCTNDLKIFNVDREISANFFIITSITIKIKIITYVL